MIAGFTRGTQQEPLPLLPSGPGGVHGVPLREARLSYPSANSYFAKTAQQQPGKADVIGLPKYHTEGVLGKHKC